MSILNVAKFILEKCGPMSAMKLQKIAYYSQAWHLVWDDEPLFGDCFQAWANGPVSTRLYGHHRGKFQVSAEDIPGDSSALKNSQVETLDSVLEFYGDKTAQWLSDLTHIEPPWLDARDGLSPDERSNRVIKNTDMAEYLRQSLNRYGKREK